MTRAGASAHRVTVLLELVTELPDDEAEADRLADELGVELARILGANAPDTIAAGSVNHLDSTAAPLAPPTAATELEPELGINEAEV